MTKIIGVRFRNAGKVYWFDPKEFEMKSGLHVIVETARGQEYGTVVGEIREIEDEQITQPLKSVVRLATAEDEERIERNREKEKQAVAICKEKIRAHELEMKLIDAEFAFDNSKILFYFTADGRIDFRDLVKDLASVFRTRIELRQIGVRDEAKILGGIGICGRPLCCNTWLSDFAPVSIKMAKEQSLSLNPAKISGVCGRLMCCLKNEQETYEYLNSKLPSVGESVTLPDGRVGVVSETNVLRQRVKVLVNDLEEDEKELEEYSVEDLFFRSRQKKDKSGKKDKEAKNQKEGKQKEGKEAKEGKEGKGGKEGKNAREKKEVKENREERGGKEKREGREEREGREKREGREEREGKEKREGREEREGKEKREGREEREGKEKREGRNRKESRDNQEKRETSESRDNTNGLNSYENSETPEKKEDAGKRVISAEILPEKNITAEEWEEDGDDRKKSRNEAGDERRGQDQDQEQKQEQKQDQNPKQKQEQNQEQGREQDQEQNQQEAPAKKKPRKRRRNRNKKRTAEGDGNAQTNTSSEQTAQTNGETGNDE